MAAPGPECLLDANLAGTLSNGDEHDVHKTDAADAESEQADKAQQDLESHRNDAQLTELFNGIHDKNRPFVFGLKLW